MFRADATMHYQRHQPMPVLDDTRKRLLDAAGSVFAEKGFQAATVREICERARVKNIAAVNYYFRDKQRLYLEAVKHASQCRIQDTPLPVLPPGTPAAEKLRVFVRTMLVRMVDEHSPRWHVQLMMRELLQPTEACVEMVRDFIRPQFERLQEILAELLPPGTSAVKRHQVAFSIVGQCLYYRMARPVVALLIGADEFATYDLDGLTDHIASFSLAALRKMKQEARAR
jgi:AcrR family transcriptional regulator